MKIPIFEMLHKAVIYQTYSDVLLTLAFIVIGFVTGPNCSEMLQSKSFVLQRFVVRCEASLSSPHSHVLIEDIAKVTTELDLSTG